MPKAAWFRAAFLQHELHEGTNGKVQMSPNPAAIRKSASPIAIAISMPCRIRERESAPRNLSPCASVAEGCCKTPEGPPAIAGMGTVMGARGIGIFTGVVRNSACCAGGTLGSEISEDHR